MKLYTEEEIKKFIQTNVIEDEDDLALLTPIELPSDEELKKQFHVDEFDPYDLAYLGGAIRMRNLIQERNK